jgi:hypothetical protein
VTGAVAAEAGHKRERCAAGREARDKGVLAARQRSLKHAGGNRQIRGGGVADDDGFTERIHRDGVGVIRVRASEICAVK